MGGFTFRAGDAEGWHRSHRRAAHPHAPVDLCGVTPLKGRGALLMSSTAMAVGVYVVVDTDDVVQYIGKVCREDPSAIRDRFATHHACRYTWDGVWLLPLRDDCPNHVVETLEANMIRAFRPTGNVVFAARVGQR